MVGVDPVILQGKSVLLEPLEHRHLDGLVAASAADPSLYAWSLVPQGRVEAENYIGTALARRSEGTALPFAIIRLEDGATIGSTRFFDLEWWPWPAGHPSHGRAAPDVCEIGYTWLTSSAIRTAANTESKALMLAHAFEVWRVHRVCFHTDVRNQRSRAALERIGARYEGTLRAHRMAADYSPRDSARFSILSAEWPAVKERLAQLLNR